MKILGIDPGIKGGVALLSNDGLIVEKMPVLSVNSKSTIDLAGLDNILYAWKPDAAIIESQQAMPGQGVSSCFRIGLNYGVLLGVLHALSIPVTDVNPRVWKRSLNVPADKDAARHRATQLFPNNSISFAKKSADGLAEAALIAYYYKTKNFQKGIL